MRQAGWWIFWAWTALTLWGCAQQSSINIAYVGSLSGQSQSFSTPIIQAMTLAIDEVNSQGGINGRLVNLVLANTQSESIMDLVRDMIDIDQVVAGIGPERSSTAMELLTAIDDFQFPLISPAASNADLTLSSPYFFRVLPSDATQAKVLAHYVSAVMGISRLSIIAADDEYSTPLARHFESNYILQGGQVDYFGVIPLGGQDVRFYVDKVAEKKSEALLLPLDMSELAVVLHRLDKRGMYPQIIGTDTFSRSSVLERAGPQAEGAIYSSTPTRGAGVEEDDIRLFDKQYATRFGERPDTYSRNAYDATRLLLAAVAKTEREHGTLNRELIRDAIAATQDFSGITGIITFDQNGDIYRGIEMFSIQGGGRESLGLYNVNGGQLFRLR